MNIYSRFSPQRSRRHTAVGAIFALLSLVSLCIPMASGAQASTLTTPRIYLNRQQANISSGIQFEVFFTATTAVTGGAGTNKVIIVLPLADNGKWCRTAGTDLVVTGVTNASGVPVGSTEGATVLPGTLLGACTQGNGTSTYDTITVTGVDNLSAGTKYGVQIKQKASSPVGLLGTATNATNSIQITLKTNNGTSDVDTAVTAISLISSDQVSVTATILPTITVSYDTTSVALGTLDQSHVNQGQIQQTVSTNAGNGYISMVKYNGVMTAGTNTIPDATGTIAINQSKFGVSTSQSGRTISVWNPTSCSGQTTSTVNASQLLSASYQDFAASGSAVASDISYLCFSAGANATQAAGVYTTTITVTTTARF